MRRWMFAALTGAALTMAALPAQAQGAWKSYIVKDIGFSFMAPGEVKTEIGTFRGAVAGPRQSLTVRELSLTGDRDAIRRQTAEQALYLLAEAFGMDTQSMDHSATPRQQQ